MAARFLHLADLHLGSRHDDLGEVAETRSREVLETFRDSVDFALDPEQGVDGILISGNLFEEHAPDPETLAFVRGLLGRLVAAKKPVVLVPGYRDGYGYKDSVYRTERWPGVTIISDATPGEAVRHTIRDEDVYFYGVSAQPGVSPVRFQGFERITLEDEADGALLSDSPVSSSEQSELELELEHEGELAEAEASDISALLVPHLANPALHIGLLCAGLDEHAETETRPHSQLVDGQTLADSNLDYIALGGNHAFASFTFDGTTAAYPGTLEGRRFEMGDLGEKHLLVVDVDEGHVKLTQHPIGRCRLEDWTIDLGQENIQDPDTLVASLLARSGDNIIARINLTGPVEFMCDLDEIADKVRTRFRHIELIDSTDLLESGMLRRIQGEHTIRGFFVRRMLDRIAELQQRQSTTSDPEATVHRELKVARTALKLGLEQFLEDEEAHDVVNQAQSRPSAAPKHNGTSASGKATTNSGNNAEKEAAQ